MVWNLSVISLTEYGACEYVTFLGISWCNDLINTSYPMGRLYFTKVNDIPCLKAYPAAEESGRFDFCFLKWKKTMNMGMPGVKLFWSFATPILQRPLELKVQKKINKTYYAISITTEWLLCTLYSFLNDTPCPPKLFINWTTWIMAVNFLSVCLFCSFFLLQ